MEIKEFDKEFVERTKIIIQTQCNDKYPYDVTLLLNCLMGLVSLPTERTKINDITFKTLCVNKLKSMGVIMKSTDDNKTFRTVKNAVSHCGVEVINQNGEIDTIVLRDKKGQEGEIHTELHFKVEQLKDFALFVADMHLERIKTKEEKQNRDRSINYK